MRRLRHDLWAFLLAVGGAVGLAAAPGAEAGFEKTAGGIRFTFHDPAAGAVSLAGEFNGWNAETHPLVKDASGVWSIVVALPPGEHQYKYVVNGEWMTDPENGATSGDYGNSLLRVGADGSPAAAPAAANTPLSGKLYLGSRYIALFQGRRDEAVNPEWDFTRPDFDIDLDFRIQVNDLLRARILTNINNQNQNVQLWETSLRFDRGNLTMESDDLSFIAYDNDSIGNWNDPLHLVGNIGIYGHAWGYEQQGIMAWKRWGGVEARLLYSDNFRTGGTSSPNVDDVVTDQLNVVVESGATAARAYLFSESDNNKDVLAGRVEAVLLGGLTGGLSYRNDRGSNPGAFAELHVDTSAAGPEQTLAGVRYGGTVENWQGGGLDLRFLDDPAGIELYGEALYGENRVEADGGDSLRITVTPQGPDSVETVLVVRGPAEDLSAVLDQSLRFLVGAHYFAYRGWHLTGSVEYQDHDLVSGPGFTDSRLNRLVTYRGGIRFSGEEWKLWPWEASLEVENYDFSYGSDVWEDQIWFDTHNFWMEQGEHLVTVDKLVMLGGADVLSWKPRVRWMFYEPRKATVDYASIVNTLAIQRTPKYWEQVLRFHVDLTRQMGINTDSRWVRYDDPVLNLEDSFLSHFIELKYRFTPDIELGLSWGVDPWVIDGPVNEYAPIGRDQFLFSRGANGGAALTGFLDLGDVIRQAEEELEDEKRVQVEGILRF